MRTLSWKGLAILIDLLNLQLIIIGGIFSRRKEYLWPEAKRVIKRECLDNTRRNCSVVTTGLKEEISYFTHWLLLWKSCKL
jgi:glucokinase